MNKALDPDYDLVGTNVIVSKITDFVPTNYPNTESRFFGWDDSSMFTKNVGSVSVNVLDYRLNRNVDPRLLTDR